MRITHAFAGIPVGDFEQARVWYERLFGRPPDMVPQDGEAVWHVSPAASIYVVADARRTGTGLLTLAVDDLEEQLRALVQRGLAAEESETARGPRRAVVRDPDGNRITFFEDPSAGAERDRAELGEG